MLPDLFTGKAALAKCVAAFSVKAGARVEFSNANSFDSMVITHGDSYNISLNCQQFNLDCKNTCCLGR